MAWSTLTFGLLTGKTLPQVLFKNPDWFFNAYDKEFFRNSQPTIQPEAEIIYAKATSIRIPQEGAERKVVEYAVDPETGKFAGLEIVEESRPKHAGSTETLRRNHIDMSFPHQRADYDKTGYRILVRNLKCIFFGSSSFLMTKQRCEDFFDDASNFHRNEQRLASHTPIAPGIKANTFA